MQLGCYTIKAAILAAILLCAVQHITSEPTDDGSFTHNVYLDEKEQYHLLWRYNDTHITFKARVNTLGYVGFGVSSNGGMKGADIVIGWVKNSKVYFKDRHATGNKKPEIDREQNWILLQGEETNNQTSLVFVRPLRSCDTEQDFQILRETQRIIYAYGIEDPASEDDISYHNSNRGTKSVYLLNEGLTVPDLPDDIQYMDIRNPTVNIPSEATTYWRTAYRLPSFTTKHHIIGLEPLVMPENKGVVHHILIYACTDLNINDTMHGVSWNLFEPMPAMDSCIGIMFGWGIGGGPYYLPENVGYPVGGEFPLKFLMMDTHYDNPQRRTDIIDNSGLRLIYTSQTRQYDAGMMMVGVAVTSYHVIPPHIDDFVSVGYCYSECTKQGLASAPNGIKAFSTILHSHLLGVRMRLRHIRNGTELQPIASDENFDFNYQESRILPKEITIMPGDDLQMECDYSSLGRDYISVGGLGTYEEMCLAFVMFYPSVKLNQCTSIPTPQQTLSFVNNITFQGDTITGPSQYVNKTMMQVLENFDWKDKAIQQKLKTAVTTGDAAAYCFSGDYSVAVVENFKVPEIESPYVEPLQACISGKDELPSNVSPPEGFPHWAELEANNYYVAWKYDAVSVTFQVYARTQGWVGFGLSPDGKMKDSDIAIGWVNNGKVYFADRYGDGQRMPPIDKLQNWKIEAGWEYNGFTVLQFQRPLQSCDTANDINIIEGNVHIIWAYNSKDPIDASSIAIHQTKGSTVLRIINGPTVSQSLKSNFANDDIQLDIVNPNIEISSESSTYHEAGYKMIALDKKYHIVKVEPLIQAGNEENIFHLELLGCKSDVEEKFHGRSFVSGAANSIPEIQQCNIRLAVWIYGSGAFEYPENYGIPIGGDTPIKFLRLETLFSNPQNKKGLHDSSGLRITLSPAQPMHDVGVMRIGHSAEFGYHAIIPPGFKEYPITGWCTSQCFSQGLGDQEGVDVIGVLLHSHKLAKSIRLRHIRKGQELAPILQEPNFLFAHQNMVMLQSPVHISKGDELLLECSIDSSSEKAPVHGDPMADGQSCLAMIMYYPFINLGMCETASPPTEYLSIIPDFTYSGDAWSPTVTGPSQYKNQSYFSIMSSLNWSNSSVGVALQARAPKAAISNFCFNREQAPVQEAGTPVIAKPSFTARQQGPTECNSITINAKGQGQILTTTSESGSAIKHVYPVLAILPILQKLLVRAI